MMSLGSTDELAAFAAGVVARFRECAAAAATGMPRPPPLRPPAAPAFGRLFTFNARDGAEHPLKARERVNLTGLSHVFFFGPDALAMLGGAGSVWEVGCVARLQEWYACTHDSSLFLWCAGVHAARAPASTATSKAVARAAECCDVVTSGRVVRCACAEHLVLPSK